MNLGRLDREVLLEFKTQGKSAHGEPTDTWGQPATVYAGVHPANGRKYYSATGAQLVAEEGLVFTIRFRADVRPSSTRLTYGGRVYIIRNVTELGRQVGLEVLGETVTA